MKKKIIIFRISFRKKILYLDSTILFWKETKRYLETFLLTDQITLSLGFFRVKFYILHQMLKKVLKVRSCQGGVTSVIQRCIAHTNKEVFLRKVSYI